MLPSLTCSMLPVNITFGMDQRAAILQGVPLLVPRLAAATAAQQQVTGPESRQPVKRQRQGHQPSRPHQADAKPADETEAAQQSEIEAQQHHRATAAAPEANVAQEIERNGQQLQQGRNQRQQHRPRQDVAAAKQAATTEGQAEAQEAQQRQQGRSQGQQHRLRQDTAAIQHTAAVAATGAQAEGQEAQQQVQTRDQRRPAGGDGDSEVRSQPREKASFV